MPIWKRIWRWAARLVTLFALIYIFYLVNQIEEELGFWNSAIISMGLVVAASEFCKFIGSVRIV